MPKKIGQKNVESSGGVKPIPVDPFMKKALKAIRTSVSFKSELDEAIRIAIAKVVRRTMKSHDIILTPPQAVELADEWLNLAQSGK